MLQRGDLVLLFEVSTVRGGAVSYSTIWQQRNLVLVTVPAVDSDVMARHVSALDAPASAHV